MKIHFLIAFCVSIIGCNNQSADSKKNANSDLILNSISKNDSIRKSRLLIDTLTIEGKDYIVFQSYPGRDTSCPLTIIDNLRDTIYIHHNYATNGFEFEDFDNDGTLDIRMYQLSNIGGVSELIMFDKTSKSFREIMNFTDFAEPKKIENTKYWYSYQRSGCADVNWESRLFKIENFKAVEIGRLDAIFCDYELNKGIFIFKISRDKKIKIHFENKLPEKYADRYLYIQDYWTNNYRKFE
jgi:hypothetical protein